MSLTGTPQTDSEKLPLHAEGSRAESKTSLAELDTRQGASRAWMAVAAVICCALVFLMLHHKAPQATSVSGRAPGPGTSPTPASDTVQVADTAAPEAKNKDAARLALQDALRQGTDLSLVVTKLPKLEKVYLAAQQLGDISPRYQEQVASAEQTFKTARNDRGKILISYIRKVVELGGFSPEQADYAAGVVGKGDLALREKKVLELVQKHVASLKESSKPNSTEILADFNREFSEYAD